MDYFIITVAFLLVFLFFYLLIEKKKNDMIKLLYSGECPKCGNNSFTDLSEVRKRKNNKNLIFMSFKCNNCHDTFNLDYVSVSKKLSSQHSVSYWSNQLNISNKEVKEENKKLVK